MVFLSYEYICDLDVCLWPLPAPQKLGVGCSHAESSLPLPLLPGNSGTMLQNSEAGSSSKEWLADGTHNEWLAAEVDICDLGKKAKTPG